MPYMTAIVPDHPAPRPPLRVLIAAPRGFCAGVDRAIQIVELALERYGAPVYVRHEIVHNGFVVDRLRALGAVFVDELDDVRERISLHDDGQLARMLPSGATICAV